MLFFSLEHEKHAPRCPVVIAHRFLATLSDDDIAEISDTAQLIAKWTDHLQESQLPSDIATPEQPATVVKKKQTALKASKIKTNLKPAASTSCLLNMKSPEATTRRPTRQCTQVLLITSCFSALLFNFFPGEVDVEKMSCKCLEVNRNREESAFVKGLLLFLFCCIFVTL